MSDYPVGETMTSLELHSIAEKIVEALVRIDSPLDVLEDEEAVTIIERELRTLVDETEKRIYEEEAKYWDERERDSVEQFRRHSQGGLGGGEQPEVWSAFAYDAKSEAARLRAKASDTKKGTNGAD